MDDGRTPEQVIADYLNRVPEPICTGLPKKNIDPYDMAILLEEAGFEDVTYMDEDEVIALYKKVINAIRDIY